METILVGDDTSSVWRVVTVTLEAARFHILQANGGIKAVNVAAEDPGRIDLLLSDIKMPEMSGAELGELLKKTRQDVRAMLRSRFSGDLLALNYGWAFIGQPFSAKKLVEMVTEVLRHPTNHGAVTNSTSVKRTRQNSRSRFDAILTILLLHWSGEPNGTTSQSRSEPLA